MTLLESVVALVILGLAAVGVLELVERAGRTARDAEAWARAVAFAEAGMEAAKLGGPAGAAAARDSIPGFTRRIVVRGWAPHLDEIVVAVTLPDGARVELHRLRSDR